jgi:hypothetical protein
MQRRKHHVDLHRERLAAWGRAGKLRATLLTALLGLAGGGAVVDKPITLTSGTYTHPPSEALEAYPVSRRVNAARDNDPALIQHA